METRGVFSLSLAISEFSVIRPSGYTFSSLDFKDHNLLRNHIKSTHDTHLSYKLIESAFNDKNVIYRKYFVSKEVLTVQILLQKNEIDIL